MDWHYLRIKLLTDPIFLDAHSAKYASVEIGYLTWRTIILKSLNELYGISGAARHFDVLVKQTQMPAIEAILRVCADDVPLFERCFANTSGSLSEYIGQEYDFGFYVQVVDSSPFLGALSDESLIVESPR